MTPSGIAPAESPTAYHPRALDEVGSPNHSRILATVLVVLFVTLAASLIFTPWVQNVTGDGRVIAFQPIERQQSVEAPISGRIVRWEVVEGARVKRGDPLAEISDNDPAYVERLLQERDAINGTFTAAVSKAGAYREKAARTDTTREFGVASARAKIQVANDKVRAAEQAFDAAEAAYQTAVLNLERREKLAGKGLNSTRDFELAQLQFNKTRAEVEKAKASLNAERNAKLAAEADLEKVEAEGQAKVEDAKASVAAAQSDAQKARAELTKIDVRMARQATQLVTAPIDGTVLRVIARQGGEQVKAGDVLALIVPNSSKNVVELWVDGNDVPLISPGRDVRLQFEGWPALQFSGWPSVAVGTFGGKVLLVDAADNGKGEFRILVEPDTEDDPWPSQAYLRQGARANGWILLNQVSLGYELWRQFNGFPPVISRDEPALVNTGISGDGKK